MEKVWFVAALWLLLALSAVLVANWLTVSTALSEIVVGTVAQLAIGALAGEAALGAKAPRNAFLAGTGFIVLTFLAGAELDPNVFRAKWKKSSAVGLVGTISALFGLNHGIIDQGQYSQLVATVIGSVVIPTAIANAWFMPRHLLPAKERELRESAYGEPAGEIES